MTPDAAIRTLTVDTATPEGDGLRVDGPFGASGWYPVATWPVDEAGLPGRHCPVWFLKTGLPEAARARAAVVSGKTRITLVVGDRNWTDEDICNRCRNGGCPARTATEDPIHAPVGRLVL